jgi:hypothetical protein
MQIPRRRFELFQRDRWSRTCVSSVHPSFLTDDARRSKDAGALFPSGRMARSRTTEFIVLVGLPASCQ